MVRFLTEEAGANVDGETSYGWTPLHASAQQGHLEVARILVEERGAGANKADNDGWTPLHASALHNKLEVVKWLVTKRGADVFKATNDGETPFSIAIDYDSTATASFLQHWALSVLPRRASSPQSTSLAARTLLLLLPLLPSCSATSPQLLMTSCASFLSLSEFA